MTYAIENEEVPNSDYSCYAPDLPGCVAAGDTISKRTRKTSMKRSSCILMGCVEDGLPIPEPTTQVGYAGAGLIPVA